MDICPAEHRGVPQLSVMPTSQRDASSGHSALLPPKRSGGICPAWRETRSTHLLQNRPEIQGLPLHWHWERGEYWEEFGLQEKEEKGCFSEAIQGSEHRVEILAENKWLFRQLRALSTS